MIPVDRYIGQPAWWMQPDPAHPDSQGLIFEYLGRGSGAATGDHPLGLQDTGPYKRHMIQKTAGGVASWGVDKTGEIFSASGGTFYKDTAFPELLSITNQMTVEVKFSFRSINVNTPIIGRWNSPNLWLINIDAGSPTDLHGVINLSGFKLARFIPGALQTSTVYHCVMVYNGTQLKAYLNGELTDTIAASGNVLSGTMGANPLTIGHYLPLSNSQPINLSHARIWKRALTSSEVEEVTADPYARFFDQPKTYVDFGAVAAAPSTPLNPFATAGNQQITTGCDVSATATSYNAYWSLLSPVTTGDTKITGADRTGEVISGLTNGVPVYVRWTAENAIGESGLSSEVSATPQVADKYVPSLILSDAQLVGSWRIDQMTVSQPTASLRLKEDRGTRNVKLPKRNFTRELYPDASADIIGKVIPCLIGKGRRMEAFLIESATRRFKIVDHGLSSFDDFVDEDGNAFIPDTLFLSSGEFIYAAWDGELSLYVDATATGANPVDAISIILTDTERGASLPATRLDTASTGKGFGATGARVKYVRGEYFFTQLEALTFSIGLYMGEVKTVDEWIKEVSAASFSTVFIDRLNLWQVKAWEPEPSVDLDEITTIVGKPKYTWKMDSPVTRVVALYAKQQAVDNFQAFEYKDDWLRTLRNLPEHASKEIELPLSDLFSATYWAHRTVTTRGVPRRVLGFQTTQEHKELEIADFVRVVDDDINVDTVFEVLSVSVTTGDNPVNLTLIDVRGFGDSSGFWVGDSDPDWDDTWTDAEVIERRENSGFWTNEGSYADTTDALRSWFNSRWI